MPVKELRRVYAIWQTMEQMMIQGRQSPPESDATLHPVPPCAGGAGEPPITLRAS
jgi:hypothetical protein